MRVQDSDAHTFEADKKEGTINANGTAVCWGKLVGIITANTKLNASAPPCTRITWSTTGSTFWCKEPYCEWTPPPPPLPPPPPPPPPTPPPTPAPEGAMNVLFIAVDDLRAQFGQSFQTPEVLSPNIDKFFLENGGAAMQHSYVQIAVCGPSRASMLTGRRSVS